MELVEEVTKAEADHNERLRNLHYVFFRTEAGQKALQDMVNREFFTMAEADPVRRIARQELMIDILNVAREAGDENGVKMFVKSVMNRLIGRNNE